MTSKSTTNKDLKDAYIEVTGEERQFFPEHFGGLDYRPSKWYRPRFLDSDPENDRIKCEQNVINCLEKYPLAKLMSNALSKSGCELDLRKHFSCIKCGEGVTGGYDARQNRIIICSNQNKSEKSLLTTMAHEMMHMFDYCRANFDYKNLEHIACTEIRAANLFHCNALSCLIDGTVFAPFMYKGFPTCVRRKAVKTLIATGRCDEDKASQIVDKVFDRCYADLEPVGRRFVNLSSIKDQDRCYKERHMYGY